MRNLVIDVLDDQQVTLSGELYLEYSLPPGFDLQHEITGVNATADVLVSDSESGTNTYPIGRVRLLDVQLSEVAGSNTSAANSQKYTGTPTHTHTPTAANSRKLKGGFTDILIDVPSASFTRLQDFISDVVYAPPHTSSQIQVAGEASVKLHTHIPDLAIRDMPFNAFQSIQHLGLSEMNPDNMEIGEMSPTQADENGLVFTSYINLLLSPETSVGARLGDLIFGLFSRAPSSSGVRSTDLANPSLWLHHPTEGSLIQVGAVQLKNVSFSPKELEKNYGRVKVLIEGVLLPPVMSRNRQYLPVGAREVISNYISSKPTSVVLLGNANTATNVHLSAVMKGWLARMELPGSADSMLQSAKLDLQGIPFFGFKVFVTLIVENPLDLRVKIHSMNMNVVGQDSTPLGQSYVDWSSTPQILEPGVTTQLRPYTIEPQMNKDSIRMFFQTLSGNTHLSAKGIIELTIDAYYITIDIEQSGLPVEF